jgi:hypothetical protein
VGDKDKLNFCEEFRPKEDGSGHPVQEKSRAEIEKMFRDLP